LPQLKPGRRALEAPARPVTPNPGSDPELPALAIIVKPRDRHSPTFGPSCFKFQQEATMSDRTSRRSTTADLDPNTKIADLPLGKQVEFLRDVITGSPKIDDEVRAALRSVCDTILRGIVAFGLEVAKAQREALTPDAVRSGDLTNAVDEVAGKLSVFIDVLSNHDCAGCDCEGWDIAIVRDGLRALYEQLAEASSKAYEEARLAAEAK
jgi:hypothetical protein